MVGRFLKHDGKQTNHPVLRFGNIAMMPTMIEHPAFGIKQESFLVEVHSISGFSGSPVVARVRVDEAGFHGWKYKLLGVNWGHWTVKHGKVLTDDPEDADIELHMRMAMVIPTWRLRELLYAPERVEARLEGDREQQARLDEGPTLD